MSATRPTRSRTRNHELPHALLDAAPSPSASVANGTLTVLGTNGGDDIALALDPTNQQSLLVDFNNGTLPQSFDLRTFSKISVFPERGDDTFSGVGGPFATPISVSGGAGNDIITGGGGADSMSRRT